MNLLLMNEQGGKVYNEAIDNYASHMVNKVAPIHDIFTVSEILSITFGVLKEKTFDNLITAQKRMTGG